MLELRAPSPLLSRLHVLRPGLRARLTLGPSSSPNPSQPQFPAPAHTRASASDRRSCAVCGRFSCTLWSHASKRSAFWAVYVAADSNPSPQDVGRSLRRTNLVVGWAPDDERRFPLVARGISEMTRSMAAAGPVCYDTSGEERARRIFLARGNDSAGMSGDESLAAASKAASFDGEGAARSSAPADAERLWAAEDPERVKCSLSSPTEDERSGTSSDVSAKRPRTAEQRISSPVMHDAERRIGAAWDHWKKLGQPKFHVAPMVDQSELPFRMLCRNYGAQAAYTPMLHSRLFAQQAKYRANEFTTCPEDRPLVVQFCANNPDTLLEAARLVAPHCDFVDLNLGCPQGIAKKGHYGAFLMDDLPLIESLVSNLAANLTVPVSCKIRVFPELEETLRYARMLEEAGCSLLAVHGRTREQKNGKTVRADWDAIKAVKKALRIPVLANGNIRCLEDVHACMAYTGVDGVMSAESLLENPALFAGFRTAGAADSETASAPANGSANGFTKGEPRAPPRIDERVLMMEYLDLCQKYPVPMRMVRGHVHKILGSYWFRRHPDVRQELNRQTKLTLEWLKDMVNRLMALARDDI